MPYFVIHNSEGETTVEQISKEKLLNRIKSYNEEEDNPDNEYYCGNPQFLSKITERNTSYWGYNNLLIIKGEIVVPKPVKIIEVFEV